MTEPDMRTHGEILLDLVRSRTSALGDKQWGMDELAQHTGLRPHQVSNAVARIAREAKRDSEAPLLRAKTGARGQYVYTGLLLKRGRKKGNGVHAVTPTEEVPFTDEELADNALLDMSTQLASEDTVVIIDVPVNEGVQSKVPLTLVEGFAQVGEKFAAAQAVVREKAVTAKPNKVSRVRRLMRELELEMRYLENEWDALAEKGRRYDKLTMTMFGFSSNDPAAVDELQTRPDETPA